VSARWLVLIGLAVCVLLVVAAAPAGAVTFTIPVGGSDRCLECHSKPDLGTVDVNGVKKSLTISSDAFHDSMHGRLDCTSCHVGFEAREHTPEETDGWYVQAKLTACSDCHAEQFKMYDKSFHGNLVMNEGSTTAPACGDCHGSHGITDPTTEAFREKIPDICGRCHDSKEATYEDTYHGKSVLLGDTSRAVCTDCHGYHQILPKSDPASSVNAQNVVTTCGKCHSEASPKFASFLVHVDRSSPKSSFWVWLMEMNHAILIGVLFTLGGLHCVLYFYRGLREGMYHRGKR
jgi:predicted CXXCH cytochrome family protein